MQRDNTDLNAENREHKLRLQAMEQQAQLRDGMCPKHYLMFFSLGLISIRLFIIPFQA